MFVWFRARALNTFTALVIVAGALSGPVALFIALTAEDREPPAQTTHPDSRGGVAGDFASLFVAGWLRGSDLAFFHPDLTATESGFLVDRVAPVRTTERGRGLFDVVVAADLVEFVSGTEEQFRPVGLRFYAVGVEVDADGALAVMGPPALVAAPAAAGVTSPVITEMRRPTDPDLAPLNETLTGFFAAYLTGVGDVRLFSSPDSVVTAVAEAPFGRVTLYEIGWGPVPGIDDPRLRLARATVDATSPGGSQRLEYSIVMAERDDRWEVSQVLHAPVVLRPAVARQGDAE